MKRILAYFTIMIVIFMLLTSSVDAQRRRRRHRGLITTASAAGLPTAPPCPVTLNSIADCPDKGCGGANADGLLNQAKNRTDVPSQSAVRAVSLNFIRGLQQPHSWNPGADRTMIVQRGEGKPVVITGFLKIIKQEHKESCNCGLDTIADTDLHLVIVDHPNDIEATSVTVEMTPRVRAQGHTNYVKADVDALRGKLVRVTGWLMLDTQHIPPAGHSLVRSTNWEVHPITKFEFCDMRSAAACTAHNAWQVF